MKLLLKRPKDRNDYLYFFTLPYSQLQIIIIIIIVVVVGGGGIIIVIIIIIIIIIIHYACLLSQAFLPGTSLEPAVIPTAQASSFTLQYFPYYV